MFVSQLGSATRILQIQDRDAAKLPIIQELSGPTTTKNYLAFVSWLYDKTKIMGLKESNLYDHDFILN